MQLLSRRAADRPLHSIRILPTVRHLRIAKVHPHLYLTVSRVVLHRRSKNKEEPLIERKLTIPELILIAGTRVVLGVGVGLLLSGRLSKEERRAAGLSLALVGGLTTIPLALGVLRKQESVDEDTSLAA